MQKEFPDYVNFYSSFDNKSPKELKELLERNGWKSRKESWEDFELYNQWSELNLLKDNNNSLLKGSIKTNENYETLLDIFRKESVKFLAELYDENGELITSESNDN